MTRSRQTPVAEDRGYLQQVVEGKAKGGTLWTGRPARTEDGQKRERTCKHSEAAVYGNDWVELQRCPKQILYSCDHCMRYLDRPFYEAVGG